MKFLFSIVLSVAFATLEVSNVAFAVNATAVPSCNISVLPASINSNQSATLSWNATEGAIFASIDNGIGAVGVDGLLKVSPDKSTVYTLHVWNSQGEGGYCSTALNVSGTPQVTQPTVSLQTVTVHPGATKVVLANVPYTGAESVLYTIFLLTVVLSAVYAVYKRDSIFA